MLFCSFFFFFGRVVSRGEKFEISDASFFFTLILRFQVH